MGNRNSGCRVRWMGNLDYVGGLKIMKTRSKVILLILFLFIAMILLSGCSAYYKPEGSNWVFQVW